MPKHIDPTLTEDENQTIQRLMKSRDARVAKRAGVIHNLNLGYPFAEVAQQYNISPATVYNYYQRFKSQGEAGLVDQSRPGRPPKADEAYRQKLREVIERDPQSCGFAFTVWTLGSLQDYLHQLTGVELSENRLSEILQAEGYVYRRPKLDLGHQQDETLRQQVAAAIDEAKKKSAETTPSACSIWTKAGSA